jgi:uncharacterized protein with ParB-like and HNH nuclease domain
MAETLKSNDVTMTDILQGINRGKIQLPDFQRGWGWDND